MKPMRNWIVAVAITASAIAPANATDTREALIGSWEGENFGRHAQHSD